MLPAGRFLFTENIRYNDNMFRRRGPKYYYIVVVIIRGEKYNKNNILFPRTTCCRVTADADDG